MKGASISIHDLMCLLSLVLDQTRIVTTVQLRTDTRGGDGGDGGGGGSITYDLRGRVF